MKSNLPGPEICVSPLSLDFKYEQAFGNSSPEAYETLLEDCIEGDSTLYTRHDWVEQAWALVDPLSRLGSKRSRLIFPITKPAAGDRKRRMSSCSGTDGAGVTPEPVGNDESPREYFQILFSPFVETLKGSTSQLGK